MPLKCSRDRIRAFHKRLADDLRGLLDYGVQFKRGQDRSPGEGIEYNLHPQHSSFQVVVERPDGPRAPALCVCEPGVDAVDLWVSWQDVWTPTPDDAFELKSAGWGFYVAPSRCRVFRAEWDASADGLCFAQPHWHFDAELLSHVMGRPASRESAPRQSTGALVELPQDPPLVRLAPQAIVHAIRTNRIHLGMQAPPQPTGDDYPHGWHRPIDGCTGLRRWAVAVLEHAKTEITAYARVAEEVEE